MVRLAALSGRFRGSKNRANPTVVDKRVGQGYDEYEHAEEYVSRRASPRELPGLLFRAMHLVFQAAPALLVGTIVLSVFGAVLTGAQVVIGQRALAGFVKVDQGHASIGSAMAPVVAMAVIAALSGVMAIIASQLERLLGERVQRSTTRSVIGACTSVGLKAYEDPRFFDQLQRVMQNALPRPVQVTHGIIGVVRGIAGAVTLVVVLLTLAPLLIPVLLLAAVPLSLTGRRGSRSEYRFALDQAPAMRKRYYLQEILTGRAGAKEVRAFDLGGELLKRWEALWTEYFSALRLQVRRRLVLALIGRLAATLLGLAALFLLLELLAHREITLASAGAAGLALLLLATRVEGLANGTGGLYESGLFLQDLEAFLRLGRSHHEARPTLPAPPGFEELTTEGLSFRYPGSNRLALDEIDLTIHRGEVVALVGENGSGKTTLSKLLADLYEPTSGRILWDGTDIATMEPTSVRDSVAVIFQDFLMYALPAAQNIGVGRPEAIDDIESIIAAAKQSGAHEFLSSLPQGYDNYLSKLFEGGYDLSLGQWQRVALARAFYRDAPLVILDEPTSALDPRAESELFSRIRALLTGRTVLLISHRFSSVRSADRIYVMKDGTIAEHGTHEELMEQDGLYAELFTLQANAYLAGHVAS